MPNIVQLSKPADIGEMGEYICNLLLKLHGQAGRKVSLLSFVDQLNLNGTVARNVVLASALHVNQCEDGRDMKDIELFHNPQQNWETILRPTSAMGPDAVAILLNFSSIFRRKLESEPAGFLLIQSKHHGTSLNEDQVHAALASVNPNNFFSGVATKKRQEFLQAMKTVPASFAWVRVSSTKM